MHMMTGDKTFDITGGTPMPYGGGFGMGGGLIIGLLFGSLLGRRGGFGFGGDCCDGDGFRGAGFSKLESIEQQIQTQSVTDQFNATNVNINNGFRDTALGFASVNSAICASDARSDLQFANVNKNICDSTTTILNAIKDGEIQELRDKLFAQNQATQTQAIENMFNIRGQFEGSGPVITAHAPAHDRSQEFMLMAMLQNQQAVNAAINTGTNVNTGFQGQGIGQGALQAGLQH